jgi:mono/diheme cytochrome c family protein
LTNGKWLWGDGSVDSIKSIITKGVPNPKSFRSPMPAMGGTQLTPAQVTATADYIWALNHKS